MKKLVVANLKSSLTDSTVNNYVSIINNNVYDNLIICPNDKYLQMFNSKNYSLGIQDLEDNIEYYKKYGVKYAILGHFDKRIKNETNKMINDKVKICLKNNFNVILCIGNYEDENIHYILNQLRECLKDINFSNNVIIAYEPFYMINSDMIVDINMLIEKIDKIKEFTNNKYPIIYGGNVNENNIRDILNICDGVLLGRLSFDIQKFTKILQII